MASAVGMAVLDVIEEDGCQEISDRVGTHLLKGLENLRSEFEVSTHLLSSIYVLCIKMMKRKNLF